MSQSNQRTYSIRLELKDGQVVKAELQDVAKTGEKSLKSLGDRAADAAKRLMTLKGASQALGVVGKGIGVIAGAALAAGSALFVLEKRAFDAGGEIKDMATQANMSTDVFQEYRYVASQLGIEIGTLTDGFNRFIDTANDFATTGGGGGADAFKKLGLSQKEVNRGLDDSEELFQRVIQKIRQTGDEATKISLANTLFGKSGGKDFLLMIKESGTEIDRLRQEAHKLGLVMSDEMIEKADGASDKLGALAYILDTKVKVALIENSDAIIQLVNAVVDNLPAAIDKVMEFARAVHLIDPNAKSSVSSLSDLRKELERNEELLSRVNSGQIASTGGQSTDILKGNLERKIAALKAQISAGEAPVSGAPVKGKPSVSGRSDSDITSKETDSIRDKIQALRDELEISKESERQQAALRAERALGTEATAAQRKEARELALAIYDQNQVMDRAKDRQNEFQRSTDSVASSIDNGLEDALRGNIRTWEDWENALIDIITNVVLQMAKINTTSSTGGSLGSVFAAGIMDAFGFSSDTASTAATPAGRAAGGPVSSGTLYRVNEREQEYFVPQTSGKIVPGSKMGLGGGDVNISVNNNTSSKVSVESKQNGSNKDILIMIDEANASNILSKNSATRKALNQVVNPEILRR